ncbi:amino acid transporter [Stenotrophomonas sp. SAU14A_NAIMI4_5]|uniref:amino acid transporter n=1 Tax=Stenotrophomonas sp. SAU14A_NAIMI4_5 TaxID=2072413 RepID=UPI000D542114|nr:amino acid transporter [Stenotrophomonas sp. SAU14A_NAIMI4_5]AWH50757.1 amino acid transporter [Stenotrophomonas sp. SAU14A_NAIMI4_5]
MKDDSDAGLRGGRAAFDRLGRDHLLVLALTLLIGGSVIALVGQNTAARAGPAIVLSLLLAAVGTAPLLFCLREVMRRTPDAAGLPVLLQGVCGRRLAAILLGLLLLDLLATLAGAAQSGARHLYAAAGALGAAPQRWLPMSMAAALGLLPVGLAAMLRPRRALLVACGLLTVKVGLGLLLVLLAARYVHYGNWVPWMPSSTGPHRFGLGGVVAAAVPLLGVFASAGLLLGVAPRVQRPHRQLTQVAGGAVLAAMLLLMGLAALQSGLVQFAALDSTRPLSVAVQAVPQLQWVLPLVPVAGWAGLLALQVVVLLLAVELLPALWRRPGADAADHDDRDPGRAMLALGAAALAMLLVPWLPERAVLPPGLAVLPLLAVLCLGLLRPQGPLPRQRTALIYLLAPLAAVLCLVPLARQIQLWQG